jgi:hypothetical protein
VAAGLVVRTLWGASANVGSPAKAPAATKETQATNKAVRTFITNSFEITEPYADAYMHRRHHNLSVPLASYAHQLHHMYSS